MKCGRFLSIVAALVIVMAGVSGVYAESWTTYNNSNTGGAIGNNTVSSSTVDSGSVKWFGTNGGGLAKYDGTTWTKYTTAAGLAGNTVNHVDFDSSGNKWVATGTGASVYNGTSWTKYTIANSGLAGNNCLTVATESTTIWIGTYSNGVSKYDGTTWTTYTSGNSGLANNRVLDAVVDGSGNKWFGTLTGVSKYDGTTWVKYTTAQGLANNSVKAVALDSSGNLWVGTLGGVNKYNGSSWTKYTSTDGLAENDTLSIDAASNDTIWAGSNGSGVSKFASSSWTKYNTTNGLANNTVNGVDTEGTTLVWFATSGGGVSKYDFGVSPPVANFSGSPTSGNVPQTVNFTDTSTNTPTSWSWTFGDTGTSTAQNPSHQYTSVGTYTVALTASNAGGSDIETKTNYITVTSVPPVPNFSGTPTSGWAPMTVIFTDLSTGPIDTWKWVFGDGNTLNYSSPPSEIANNYLNAGTYTVQLSVRDENTSQYYTEVKTDYISVTSATPPVAGFTGLPTSGNYPLTVNFTDSSTGSITSWSWTFGDSGTSTAQNPSHIYQTTGTYNVSLTVSGPAGTDDEVKTNYITVTVPPPPTAAFSASPTSGNTPLTVNFTDQSTGSITGWSWVFGDSGTSTAQNPSHIYNTTGTYTVSLTVTGPGGSNIMTKTSYITASLAPPVAQFTGLPTSGDAPLTVEFTDQSTGSISAWSWTFGDSGTSTEQDAGHIYNTAGTYTVSLTVTGPGGSDIMTKTDYITVSFAPTVAQFTGLPTSGDVPLAVSFTDSSTGIITGWSWNFGDSGTSTAQNPGHNYDTAGTHTVSLTVTGPGGSDIETKTDYISVYTPVPAAAFTGSPVSGGYPLAVSFTDQSTGIITSWSWNFGDSGTSTVRHPAHTYNNGGSYTVSLTVSGPNGSDIKTRIDYISVNPPQYQELWTTYNNSNTGGAIGNNNIYAAAVEPGGVKWFGTNGGGLAKYDGTTWTKYTSGTSGLANNTVYDIAFDSSSNKWIATIGGVNKYTGTSWTKYTSGNSALANNNTRAIAVDNSGDIWVGTYASGLCKFNGTSWTQYKTTNSGLAGNGVRGIAVDSSNNKWIATSGGVSMYNGTTWTKYIKPPLASLDTAAAAIAPNGDKWVATLSGVNRLVGTSWVTYTTSDGLAKNDTISIAVDANGVVWAGSNGSGISKLAGATPWTVYNTTNSGLVNNTVNAVAVESNLLVWMGTGGGVSLIRMAAVPTAAFTALPISGDPPLEVNFTDVSTGEITGWSWDFGDSGTSTAQNPSHTYNVAGNYTVSLTVSGPGGSNTSTRTNYINVIAPVPGQASNPSPASGATDVMPNATLSWTAGSNAVSHNVYFGTTNLPPSVSSNQAGITFDQGILNVSTVYYWRIDEKNLNGVVTTGDLWSFTTAATPVLDPFGIKVLYPTKEDGRVWYSKWNNGHPRTFGYVRDPDDPEFDCRHGTATYSIDGAGILTTSGDYPRMYVWAQDKSWNNVEITMYGMRVEDEGTMWAGIMAYAKTDHRNDDRSCKCRGYGGRMTYDGRMDFEKEVAHHASDGYVQTAPVRPWSDEGPMPKNVWIGYKFVVRDADAGTHVKLELYCDMTDGADGGSWLPVMTEYLDAGGWGAGHTPCESGIDPAEILTGSHPVVYVRTDDVTEMRYKKFSIREIDPNGP